MIINKLIFLCICGLCIAACDSSNNAPVTDDPALKQAREIFEARCSMCHDIDRPLGKNKTPDEWKETVIRMQQKEPDKISDTDVKEILDYLNAVRGPKV